MADIGFEMALQRGAQVEFLIEASLNNCPPALVFGSYAPDYLLRFLSMSDLKKIPNMDKVNRFLVPVLDYVDTTKSPARSPTRQPSVMALSLK